jgi:hypothetical protein
VNVAYQDGLKILDAETQPGRLDFLQRALGVGQDRNITQLWLFRTAGSDMVK